MREESREEGGEERGERESSKEKREIVCVACMRECARVQDFRKGMCFYGSISGSARVWRSACAGVQHLQLCRMRRVARVCSAFVRKRSMKWAKSTYFFSLVTYPP